MPPPAMVAGDRGASRGSAEAPSRLAVVVLTDGVDPSSRLSSAEVFGIASGIDVPVYVVAVMPSVDSVMRQSRLGAPEV